MVYEELISYTCSEQRLYDGCLITKKKYCTVADDYVNNGWNFFFRRHFNDWKVDDISEILNC